LEELKELKHMPAPPTFLYRMYCDLPDDYIGAWHKRKHKIITQWKAERYAVNFKILTYHTASLA
jgi:hypothetical protein